MLFRITSWRPKFLHHCHPGRVLVYQCLSMMPLRRTFPYPKATLRQAVHRGASGTIAHPLLNLSFLPRRANRTDGEDF